MILEILFLSLAIRSYGNKFEYYETVKASENDKSNFKLETNASWPGNEYKLNEKSSCINKDGLKEENDLEYSDVSNQIVMKFIFYLLMNTHIWKMKLKDMLKKKA